MNDLLVRAARGERTERPPVWMMRQAGRHIPEYRRIREQQSFTEAIADPAVAERITLLPWELYRPDGVVMFSDILTVIEPLGFEYRIESGVGPVVENPVQGPDDAEREVGDVEAELDYVWELLGRLQDSVGEETAVLGFAGGPATLASYVVGAAEERDRDHTHLRRFRARHPEAFRTLLSTFADVTREYLERQAAAGADAVQLFDTWAGLLSPDDYREFVQPLHREILADLPVPTIVFTRYPGGKLDLLADSGADVVGLDWTVDIAEARQELGDVPVQGNLDPAYLFGDESLVRQETRRVVEKAGESGHILNLGHGVPRDAPVENVKAFFETAREMTR